MNPEPIVIELRGHVPAKKNEWGPRKGGGIGITNPDVKAAIDRLALQIRGDVRDLKLESPDIEIYFTYVKANWDTDNAYTTLLDLLVKYGVILDDNIKRFNGKKTIFPAERGEYDAVKIVLIPRVDESEPAAPRYIDPRRRRLGRTGVSTAPALALPTVSKAPGEYPAGEPPLLPKVDHITPAGLESIPQEMKGLWDDL